ncbi:GntR family transcriptional regulator [Alloalcanivorax mobilis]|uniref:GntR family transcriptional regulator n=1 Tax=Alloalcanivorax mobilis TaxID=2019569 RepID=UPI000C76AEBC|nr:GntR family transcriptional regulator [Alloalcanivorax mobilis]
MDSILSRQPGPGAASLQERIRRAVEGEIVSGARPPGSAIDEKALAQAFDASRTPVREALLLLAGQGLVRIVPRAGIFVHKAGAAELVSTLEALCELEAALARLAAQRASVEQCEAMKKACRKTGRLADANDSKGYRTANAELHELIYDASGNPVLVEQVRRIRRKLAAYRARGFDRPGRLAVSADEHAAIVRAICDGDGAAAGDAMRAHINAGGEAMAALVLAADNPPGSPTSLPG